MGEKTIKEEIFKLIKEYFNKEEEGKFIPGVTKIGVGFPCYGPEEIISALDSLMDLNLSQGKKVECFEKLFSEYIGTKYGVAVNSGSSANLLAIAALIKCGKVKKGSEVIVPAATFTTVISPIIQNGLIPVFVDVESDTYNISCKQIEEAVNKNTGLIMVVHSLGCPADMDNILKIANKHSLPVLEDCCEAHGTAINGKKVGSFGLISTSSFFVAHNMTTGEGGMILTNDEGIDKMLKSMREFGRLREKKTTEPRFHYNDKYMKDYDERYVFEVMGYNVRMTDINASLGIEQLKKLDKLNLIRNEICNYYTAHLKKYKQYIQLPTIPTNCFHSFYSYPIIVLPNGIFDRKDIVRFLEDKGIETRAFMGGDLSKQPAYRDENIKVMRLNNTNLIFNNAFFIGCHPHITEKQREFIIKIFDEFFDSKLKDN